MAKTPPSYLTINIDEAEPDPVLVAAQQLRRLWRHYAAGGARPGDEGEPCGQWGTFQHAVWLLQTRLGTKALVPGSEHAGFRFDPPELVTKRSWLIYSPRRAGLADTLYNLAQFVAQLLAALPEWGTQTAEGMQVQWKSMGGGVGRVAMDAEPFFVGEGLPEEFERLVGQLEADVRQMMVEPAGKVQAPQETQPPTRVEAPFATDDENGQSGQQPDVTKLMEQVAQAAGDGSTAKILAIAGNADLSGEQKMRLILRLDGRFEGKTSTDWAKLLDVKASAIRQYDTWKELRRKAKGGDD